MDSAKVAVAVDLFKKQLRAEKRARDAAREARRAMRGMTSQEISEYVRLTDKLIQESE